MSTLCEGQLVLYVVHFTQGTQHQLIAAHGNKTAYQVANKSVILQGTFTMLAFQGIISATSPGEDGFLVSNSINGVAQKRLKVDVWDK